MNRFSDDFFFGVSNAAGQAEDQLENTFTRYAEKQAIPNYFTVEKPADRVRFWTEPEIEINLAAELGCQVFRLSFAWERLVPRPGEWDEKAALRYKEIMSLLRQKGIRVMATLFHHSLPCWFEDEGGWANPQSVEHFDFYSQKAFKFFADDVNYWITLNEPAIWSVLTYWQGILPPGRKGSWFQHQKSLKHMARAHNHFYDLYHDKAKIGIAHHMGWHVGQGFFNQLVTYVTDYIVHWQFLRKIEKHLNFFGINYYGAEWITPLGPVVYDHIEYSDAGRAVSPEGLEVLLKRIHREYPHLPIIITENGVGDETDALRAPYLIEHLKVIHQAIQNRIPVIGYIHWTLSDNWEWVDGYGPKFGLVEVRRDENLKRVKRKSFDLYQKIIRERGFSEAERESIWSRYRTEKTIRQFWRGPDGKSCLSKPILRPQPPHDWKYKA